MTNVTSEVPIKPCLHPKMCLDNFSSGENSEKSDQLYFLANFFFIANLFNITLCKSNAHEAIYNETLLDNLMNYRLKFGQNFQCTLNHLQREQLSRSIIDIRGVTALRYLSTHPWLHLMTLSIHHIFFPEP